MSLTGLTFGQAGRLRPLCSGSNRVRRVALWTQLRGTLRGIAFSARLASPPEAPTEATMLLLDLLVDTLEGAFQDVRHLGHSRAARSVIVHEEPDAVAAQDRLLWERWPGRVSRGGAGSRGPESLFAQISTGHGDGSEVRVEREKSRYQTNVCSNHERR